MIFHNIEQNTDEWHALRCGKITGSNFGKIMANEGKAFGEPAKDYALRIALERITGEPKTGGFSNEHTERGHTQEPLARMLYEEVRFCDVLNGGFYDLGNIGCSPDGRVGPGIIEIKSVIDKVHYANVKRGAVDPSYKWQVIGNLKCTGAEWIDWISYCDEYPAGKKLFVFRTWRNDCADEFKRLDDRLSEFEKLIVQRIEEILR